MTTPETSIAARKPRRRRLQFSLRTLLLVMMVLCIVFAWVGNILLHVYQQRGMVAKIEAMGGEVSYDYQLVPFGAEGVSGPPGPRFLRYIFGDDAFAYVESVTLTPATGNADLALLGELPRLHRVTLWGKKFTNESMRQIVTLPQLEYLSLSSTSVDAEGLATLSQAKGLRSLMLDEAEVTDDLLPAVSTLTQLEELCLIRSNVTPRGMAHVARLGPLKTLLIYGGTAIDDDALIPLSQLRNLEVLSLYRTNVTGAGFSHLSQLARLRHLDLRNSPVGDEGIQHLSSMSQLTALYLDGTNVSDAAMGDLAKLRSLQYLGVGPQVTEEASLQLHESLPQCRIVGHDPNDVNNFVIEPTAPAVE